MPLGKGLSSLIPNFRHLGSAEVPAQDKSAPLKTSIAVDQSGASANSNNECKFLHVSISLIRPNIYQPRKVFNHDDLEDMINSIKEFGIIQPLLVTENDYGGYDLVAGERRWRAAQIAGLSTVPVVVKKVIGSAKLEMALIENIQRKDLNPLEQALAFDILIKKFGLMQEEIAKKIGKSRPFVANTLRLLSLPEEIKKGLIDEKISGSAARALLGFDNPREQIDMYRQLLEENRSVKQIENDVNDRRVRAKRGGPRRDPMVDDYERQLREKFGTKVNITNKSGKGVITISYYSEEELARLIRDLS